MPRVSPSLIRRAYRISPFAAALLPACRELPSALAELRWLREHVQSSPSPVPPGLRLWQLCEERGRGVPLQYVLGTQPFGHLDILCRPGVLIPRPEPEAYTMHLAHLLRTDRFGRDLLSGGVSVVDLCSGTGCIALLLYALLQPHAPALRVCGVDISPRAVRLARENAAYNVARGHMPAPAAPGQALVFEQGDLFSPEWARRFLAAQQQQPSSSSSRGLWDVLVCNPPYISPAGFARATARSVRNYEPRLAQVPSREAVTAASGAVRRPEDVFYARLLELAGVARPRVMLFEVGDLAQAVRVAGMAVAAGPALDGSVVEIWRDWPDAAPGEGEDTSVVLDSGVEVSVRGSGHGRSVLIYRDAASPS